jgi:hypothetical protein
MTEEFHNKVVELPQDVALAKTEPAPAKAELKINQFRIPVDTPFEQRNELVMKQAKKMGREFVGKHYEGYVFDSKTGIVTLLNHNYPNE